MPKFKKKNFIEIWGDGNARREFMYAEDLAGAIWFCLEKITKIPTLLNVGIGRDYSIVNYYRFKIIINILISFWNEYF